MAITHKLSYAELKSVLVTYIDSNKIASDSFQVTRNNTVGLLDKVGKIVTMQSNVVDKLAVFDGESMEYGKTIEEWKSDLILPVDYTGDPNGDESLKEYDLTYRPVCYSYTLGRKFFPLSIKNDDIERAVNNAEQLVSIVADKTKTMNDSDIAYRYGAKRQVIAELIKRCKTAQETSTTYSNTGTYAVNTVLKQSSSSDVRGIVVKAKPSTSITWANAVAQGYIIPLDLVDVIAIPTDEASGEAFIEKVKKDVEIASDMNEGHSLNGNTLGATTGLVLLVKQGVKPTLDVKTLAGAFNQDKLEMGVDVISVKDFGDNTDAFAVLVDKRAIRLHPTYNAVRENMNGAGDRLNMFKHFEYTAFISKNTFVKVYKGA